MRREYIRPVRRIATALTLINLMVWSTSMAADNNETSGQDSSQLTREIEAFLATYAEVYNRQDYTTLVSMWDQDDPDPIYIAEEINPPMQGWDRINAYFNPKPGFSVLDGIRNEYTDIKAHYLGKDLAIATYKLRFDIKVKNQTAMSSWERVMAVFRKKDGEWKMTAYAEAPMAPLTMVREMIYGQVPDDFDAWLDQQDDGQQ